jgi:peroxiredoxin
MADHPRLHPGQQLPSFLGKRDVISVVLFFRGSWCPVCRRYLMRIAEHGDEWRGLGASIIAVSSYPLNSSDDDAQLQALDIEYIYDSGAIEISRLGIKHDDDDHGAIAHPAVLIADDQGTIRYAHIGLHPRDRPEPEAILLAVRRLAEESATRV